MTHSPYHKKHIAALTALFILGDSVIRIPAESAGSFTFWGLILTFAATLLLYPMLLPAVSFLTKSFSSKNTAVRITAAALLTAAAVYSLRNAGLCFKRFIDFVSVLLLPDTPEFFITLLFIAVVAALAVKNQEVLLKFSLISFAVSAVIIILFFALSAKDFNFGNIAVYRLPSASEFKEAVLPFIRGVSLPLLLLPVYNAVYFKKAEPAASLSGIAFGFIMLSLCLLDSLLIFGPDLAARIDYPLSAAVSTVTVGPLFFRMDGVSYFLYFTSSLIKTVFCLKLSYSSLKKIKEITKK